MCTGGTMEMDCEKNGGGKGWLIKNLHQCSCHFALLNGERQSALKLMTGKHNIIFFQEVSNYYSSPVLAKRPFFVLHVN